MLTSFGAAVAGLGLPPPGSSSPCWAMAAGLSNGRGEGAWRPLGDPGGLAAWRACAMIVAMGSLESACSPLKEGSKTLEMMESKEGNLARPVIVTWDGA